MTEAGIQEVETYVARRHNTVAKFIATRPIMDLCLAATWSLGSRVSKRWWDQEGLGLEGIYMLAQTADLEQDEWEGEETGG